MPIIIYYLMRYRSMRVGWGANYVLERALERLRKKLYLDQLILIAIRVLSCLLLVVAFARPISRTVGARISGSGRHHVIIADGSYSMRAGESGQTRWDRAKETMKKLVSSWGRGEKWSLLVLGQSGAREDSRRGKWVVEEATIKSQQDAISQIESLQPGESASSIRRALQDVREKYGADPIDVYLFADDQASAWKELEGFLGSGQNSILENESGKPVSVSWINPPLRDRTNLAVTQLRPPSDVILAGHPTRIFVAVQNFSSEPVNDVEVSLLRGGAHIGKDTISLLPGQTRWLHIDVKLKTPGSHVLTARLGKDALAFDNRMSAGIQVREEISVLVLRDKDVTGKFESAWSFLEIAKQIQEIKKDGERIFRMGPLKFTLCPGECPPEELKNSDIVFLDGGKTVSKELAERLSQWVNRGGGLVLSAGERVEKDRWNEAFGQSGLLPGQLGKLRAESLGGDTFRSLSRARFNSSAFRIFETTDQGDVSDAKIYAWHEMAALDENAAVLMEYDDQSPFAVARRKGVGRVVLLTAGLSGRSSNLVVREFYLPLVYRLFDAAAAGTVYPRTVSTGEDLKLLLEDPENLRAVTYHREDGRPVPLEPVERDGSTEVVVGSVQHSGSSSILQVRQGGTSRVWYGVQGPRDDSDLRAMDPQLRSALEKSPNVAEVSGWAELEEILKEKSRGSEWHHWVVAALLLLLVGEMFVERRFV